MHGVSSLSLLFVKSDADIGHKSANKVADMARDLQRLTLNNCNKRGVNISFFQLSNAASSFSNKTDWKANKYEFNWATLQKQAKDTNDTNQRIWGLKLLKFVLRWRRPGSHKPTNPLQNWLSARQWAGERGDPGFPQEFLSKSNRRIWMQACAISYLSSDPLWPRLQLVSLGPNALALIAEIWEPIWTVECSKAGKASTCRKRPVASNMLRWPWAKIGRDGIFDLAMHLVDQLGAVYQIWQTSSVRSLDVKE